MNYNYDFFVIAIIAIISVYSLNFKKTVDLKLAILMNLTLFIYTDKNYGGIYEGKIKINFLKNHKSVTHKETIYEILLTTRWQHWIIHSV